MAELDGDVLERLEGATRASSASAPCKRKRPPRKGERGRSVPVRNDLKTSFLRTILSSLNQIALIRLLDLARYLAYGVPFSSNLKYYGEEGDFVSHLESEITDIFNKLESRNKENLIEWGHYLLSKQGKDKFNIDSVPVWSGSGGRDAVQHIRAMYGREINGEWKVCPGVTRSAIREHDPKLDMAYANWLRKHPDDRLPLPRRYTADSEREVEARREYQRRRYTAKRDEFTPS